MVTLVLIILANKSVLLKTYIKTFNIALCLFSIKALASLQPNDGENPFYVLLNFLVQSEDFLKHSKKHR